MFTIGEILNHREWFFLRQDGGPGISFFLSQVVVAKGITEIILRYDIRVELYLLQAKKIRIIILDENIEGFFAAGTKAVHIPGCKFQGRLLSTHE